jgi:hypothetical protein
MIQEAPVVSGAARTAPFWPALHLMVDAEP